MSKNTITFSKRQIEEAVEKQIIKLTESMSGEESLQKLVGSDSKKSIRTPKEIADRQLQGKGPDLAVESGKDAEGMETAQEDLLAPEELVDVLESLDGTLSLLSKAAVKHSKSQKQKDKLFKIYDEVTKLKTKIIKDNNISH